MVDLARFERGDVDGARFHHVDHVRVAYEMLGRHAFDDALARYARGLRAIARAGGRPERFHMTITVAFLAAIAERRAADPALGWDAFVARHGELLDRRFLERWYAPARLASQTARTTFVLPTARPSPVPLVPGL